MSSMIPPAPPTPSWARGKNYDKALIWDIEDLIERQKRKAVAENLRQKLLRSQETGTPRSQYSASTVDNTCQHQGSGSPDLRDMMNSSHDGLHQSSQVTERIQDASFPNAPHHSFADNPTHDPSTTASQQPHPSPPTHPLNSITPHSSLPATPAATPPHSEPSMTVSLTPASPSHSPVEPPAELGVISGGRVKKAKRGKKGRVAKMVYAWRRDVFVNGEGGGGDGGDGV